MIDFFQPTEPFGGQTLRLSGEAQNGAGDIFEIAGVVRGLEVGDTAGWMAAWIAAAEKAEAKALVAHAAGHSATAIERSFAAAGYYRQSDVFAPGGDPTRAVAFKNSVRNFRRAASLHSPEIRYIQVSFGGQTFDGYLCLPNVPKGTKVPGVFLIGGADSYAEENYFSGKGIVDRGMAMLLLDTPGRGSAIYLNGIPTRYDYEVPTSAALDWLAAQPEIDADKLGLVGISLGGYYAPRATAFDKRVKALACWSGIFNMLDDIYLYYPHIQKQLQWILGVDDDATARKMLADFSLKDVAPKISVPTWVTHGQADRIMDVGGAQRFYDALTVKDKQLHIMTGPGQMHCSYDDWRDAGADMFDWLRDKLDAAK